MKPSFTVSVLTMLMGIMLSGVAAFFSVLGLATIFSGAFVQVAIMGGALEACKLIAASWIYRHWKIAPLPMKIYMSSAVVILILITSLGIFGFLSKAHIDSTLSTSNTELSIATLDSRIERQEKIIEDSDRLLSQLDSSIETLIEYDRISGPEGAIARREAQRSERERLNTYIDEASYHLQNLREERAVLASTRLESEAKLGPLKYLAELIYGEERASEHFDAAVRTIILIIVLVFDPLAVCLLLAANTGFMYRDVQFKDGKVYFDKDCAVDLEEKIY